MRKMLFLSTLTAVLAGPLFPPAHAQAPAQPDALAGLTPAERAFATDPHKLAEFRLTPEKVRMVLTGRSTVEAKDYIDAMMNAVAKEAFQPGDQPDIPLNTTSALAFNGETVVRPAILDDLHRDPGPIILDRYIHQKTGIPTFAHAPFALHPEDLEAGHVEVAFVGVPQDFSTGWRDALHGPMMLRTADYLTGSASDPDPDTGINPGAALRLADYGDLAVDYMSVERSEAHIRDMIAQMARLHVVPFVIGGDHSVMFPDVSGLSSVYGHDAISIVQFDAHGETDWEDDGHLRADNQSVRRLVENGSVLPQNIIQVGVRDGAPSIQPTTSRPGSVVTHPVTELEQHGTMALLQTVNDELKTKAHKVIVSFDLSVLDPAYATGTGRPLPGGMTMREAIPLVRGICASNTVVGFELLDPAPVLDTTYQTGQNANAIMHACLTGIALNRHPHT